MDKIPLMPAACPCSAVAVAALYAVKLAGLIPDAVTAAIPAATAVGTLLPNAIDALKALL